MPRCKYEIIYERPNKQGPGLTRCPRRAVGNSGGSEMCEECAYKYQLVFDELYPDEYLTFAKFSETNRKRCESPVPNGFGESIIPGSEYDAEHWALAAGEEMGEVIGAVLGMTGRKARKKHLTKEDVCNEIGDVVACLDLLAQSIGSSVGECARTKFNMVSDRIGSNIKL